MRISVEAYVVLSARHGAEQWVITVRRKKQALATCMITVPARDSAAEEVKTFLFKMVSEQITQQHSVYWENDEHPFQEELPF